LKQDRLELILEIGSGISPLATNFPNVVFSDISVDAIKSLKERQKSGYYVVADGMSLPFKSHVYSHAVCSEVLEHLKDDRRAIAEIMSLPFKSHVYSHAVCSEVLEHLKDDRRAIAEIYRTLKKPYGKAIITVPHRKWYFGYDDRYVKHYRRYELPDIKEKLQSVGLKPVFISKVLGPLEKITMLPVVFFYSIIEKRRHGGTQDKGTRNFGLMKVLAFLFKWLNLFWGGIVWLDAKIMPRFLATVILIKSTVSKEKI
jgi:SAM-dependent methyltransferase